MKKQNSEKTAQTPELDKENAVYAAIFSGIVVLFVACLIILLVLTAGEMSYQDALIEEQQYMEMVCSGAWPDFNNLKPSCSK